MATHKCQTHGMNVGLIAPHPSRLLISFSKKPILHTMRNRNSQPHVSRALFCSSLAAEIFSNEHFRIISGGPGRIRSVVLALH